MKRISVITPTFHCKDLALIFVKSFEKFRPKDLIIDYVVVENSNDVSYRDEILSVSPLITWINNPIDLIGSNANASGIIKGMEYVTNDWVFVAHCDVCVTSERFYSSVFSKVKEGNMMVGTVLDPSRIKINAIHVSGFLIDAVISRKINYFPRDLGNGIHLDVGDDATLYCRENNVKHFCFRNTFNSPFLINNIDKKYQDIYCDRCLDDDDNVIFMHLGRGIPKTNNTYKVPGKTHIEKWKDFCYNRVII